VLKAVRFSKLTMSQYNSGVLIKLNIHKTNIIYFTCKTNFVHFNYCVSTVLILRSDCIKDLGVTLDSNLYFHSHVNVVYSQAHRALGLIHYITYNFSSLGCLVTLHNALIRSKLDYTSVIWNNLTLTDSNKTENIKNFSICAIIVFFHIFYVMMI
jgi:hypothetical protein